MNPQKTDKTPNYSEILQEILSGIDGPISTDELAAKILEKRPTNARNPQKAALVKIRDGNGHQLVYLDPSHVLPLRLAYRGARYRIRLDQQMVDQSALPLIVNFYHYLPNGFPEEEITLIDSHGDPISAQIAEIPYRFSFSPEESKEYEEPAILLKEWFRAQNISLQDHILVTIENWERGVFRLECERFDEQQADLLAERNRYIANAFYQLLEADQNESIYVHIALPTIYARMPDKSGYPPDHWSFIIDNDARMENLGAAVRYIDSFSTMDRMFAEASGESLVAPGAEYTKEEEQQIYRLRAHLKYAPSIWREIEIQGDQTLADLDEILRNVFEHDLSAHMSGFWKKIARSGGGKIKRYREVDLGAIDPCGEGEGASTAIAALKLKPGDQLKYVYDFGDWLEHGLQLSAIVPPEEGIQYPREIARNKMKSEYCVECRKKGTQTVATWICYTCSEQHERRIVLCEACIMEQVEHEDHYNERILY